MKRMEWKIVLVLVIVTAFIWIADAAIDTAIFGEGSFLEAAFDASGHEIYFRLFSISVCSAFTIVLLGMLAKHRRSETEVRQQAAAIETSMDGIVIYDREWVASYANTAFAAISGCDSPQGVVGRPFRSGYEEQSVTVFEQSIAPAIRRSGKWQGELIAKRKNGSTYFQEASITQLPEDAGFVCIVRDVTWRKRSETRLRRSEQFLNNIFNSIRDPFCIFDRDYQIVRLNEAYAQMKHRTAAQLLGRKCYEVLAGREDICPACVVEKSFLSTDPCAKDKSVTLPNGETVWVEIYTYPILDEEGRVSHVIEYTRDITARKRSEEERRRMIEKLEHLSRVDMLTGLLNRRALTESLTYEIDRACRYDTGLALLLCDIDRFKEINDSFGHDAGDRALQLISAVLKTLLRKTDIAGRYGGDEFMLILPATNRKGAESLAEKLKVAVEGIDLQLGGEKGARLSISVGVTEKLPIGETIDTIIKRADEDMYAAKQKERNGHPGPH